MYNFLIKNITNKYDYEELLKVFLKPDEFRTYTLDELEESNTKQDNLDDLIIINDSNCDDKNHIKREIYNKLYMLTGYKPEWGILTGVRPVKLTGELFSKLQAYSFVRRELSETYLISDDKIDLLLDTFSFQQQYIGYPDKKSVGIYIGIPFCPTRCLYCSFTSNQVGSTEIEKYLSALKKEIEFVGKRMKEKQLFAESIYVGGGTPTTLTEQQLKDLLLTIRTNINLDSLKEFTVEAGRPDTITIEKLDTIKNNGVNRISINPQSMKAHTLDLIGRSHSPKDIVDAFKIADDVGIPVVNADIIAGLPEESPEDFEDTIDNILALGPENITVHTLAVKRASRLAETDKDYHYKQGEIVGQMLEISKIKLKAAGFQPYYLYRQKHMAGSFENIGYCKENTPCIYNIRIMEERQNILALGAGGISKIYFPDENRLERIPNVSNYEIYISRIEEMLDRKEKNFFKEV